MSKILGFLLNQQSGNAAAGSSLLGLAVVAICGMFGITITPEVAAGLVTFITVVTGAGKDESPN